MKVYLSGAIEQAENDGADWRNELSIFLEERLGHEVIDPVKLSDHLIQSENAEGFRSWKKSDLQRFKSFMRKIIKQDIMGVTTADYTICLWNRAVEKGGGTQGEITLSWIKQVPVYLVYEGDIEDLSSWIIGCTTEIFPDFADLKHFLLKNFGGRHAGT
ncbi:MAG: hypothetical protein ACE5D8_09235 [Fidelibacterota bacterium]